MDAEIGLRGPQDDSSQPARVDVNVLICEADGTPTAWVDLRGGSGGHFGRSYAERAR
ncbi:MAG: hypothetical protein WCB14_15735 [Candidatus Acidiferrales bacterium]